jgi:hypothetical protein
LRNWPVPAFTTRKAARSLRRTIRRAAPAILPAPFYPSWYSTRDAQGFGAYSYDKILNRLDAHGAPVLVIRSEQFNALARVARLDYEDSLIRHFRRFYPVECQHAGAEQVRKLIRYGIDRAMVHGYAGQREVALYINLMLILGCDFDRDPQYPWAGEQLNDASIEADFARIQRVFQTTIDYLGKTSGAGNEYLFRALSRMREYDLASAPQSSGVQLQEDLLNVLASFYPEKYGSHTRDELIALVRRAAGDSFDYGIREAPGRVIYTTLAFMLGAGIARDPMYPWVGATLADRAISGENARVEVLHRKSVAYVNLMLSKS